MPAPASSARVAHLGVVTRDRLPQLKRCVTSFLRHLRDCGRVCEIGVCDDSESPAVRESCRELLGALARRYGVAIGYAGREEKTEYVDRLIALGIAPSAAHFALSNTSEIAQSPGANRNAFLLHFAGAAFLACDDDCVCQVEDLREGLQTATAAAFAPTADRTHFLASERAERRPPGPSRDLVAAHEELLGRPLRELVFPICCNGGPRRAAAFAPRVFSDLAEGRGRVAVTISGVRGDSGIPHAVPFMTATGEGRARFLGAWAAGNGCHATRSVRIGPENPILSWQGPLATTTATGFDHRELLPPFSPAGRGEDSLFGLMLGKCAPDAYIGYVPATLLHAPAGPRSYGPLPAKSGLIEILGFALSGCADPFAGSPVERMKAIGRYLADCGRAGFEDFVAYLLRSARRARWNTIGGCERLLEAYRGEPAFWAAEMERWIASLESGLTGGDAAVPADLVSGGAAAEAYRWAQSYVARFGKLLECWPDIVSAAGQLNAAGHGVCRTLNRPLMLSVNSNCGGL